LNIIVYIKMEYGTFIIINGLPYSEHNCLWFKTMHEKQIQAIDATDKPNINNKPPLQYKYCFCLL